MVDGRRSVVFTVAAVLACLAVASAACRGGSGGGGSKPQASVTVEEQPSGPAPTPVVIKVPGTEPVILPLNAALASDPIELARQTGYSSPACTPDQNAPQAGPVCRAGEDAGSPVVAVAALQCEGSWLRPEAVPDAYRAVLGAEPHLFAMYVPKHPAGAFGSNLGAQFVVVMQGGSRLDGTPAGFALHIKEGRIVMLQTICSSFDALVSSDVVDSFVVAPVR